jgi:hypothetical protein
MTFLKNLNQYKLIYIYGDSDEILRILSEIRKSFSNISFQKFEVKDDISEKILSNDLFEEKKIFLTENITSAFFKNKKLFENLLLSDNLCICTSNEYHKIDLSEKFYLSIEAKKQTINEKKLYINSCIQKNHLTLSNSHLMLIQNLLSNENFLIIENEINKLKLLMKDKNFQLTDEKIYNLFNLPDQSVINDFIETILFQKKESFEILFKILNKYDAILIIRSIYNYFLKLQNLFIFMRMEKKSFDVALKEQYGLFIGSNKSAIINILKTFTFDQISNILSKIVNCEISLKKENQREFAILEKLLLDIF